MPGRRSLPRPALPHARLDLAVAEPPCDLDVRPLREPLVHLEQRADARQVVGVAFDDGVRVADVDRGEADAVDLLRLARR